MKRKLIAAVGTVLLATGIGFIWHQSTGRESHTPVPVGPAVNPTAPEHALLQDALDITAERQAGSTNFSYVPRNRPPGLLRMHIGGQGDAVTDTYQFGPQKLNAIVAFSGLPISLCDNIRKNEVSRLCVRDTPTSPKPTNPAFQHVTAYFTSNVAATPSTSDPQTATAKQFWASTDLVPIETASWFTDLVKKGRKSRL